MLSQALLNWVNDAWAVFVLFLIPIGGGIPAGVLLAKARGINWWTMEALYFSSDVVLAFAFEPLTWLFIEAGNRYEPLGRFNRALKQSMTLMVSRYGINPGPLTLVMISFGVDPMTGRAAALAAGHGFLTGWLIAITGDMIFFSAIMVSAIWLNSVLGDGTWAVLLVVLLMTLVPILVRRVRSRLTRT